MLHRSTRPSHRPRAALLGLGVAGVSLAIAFDPVCEHQQSRQAGRSRREFGLEVDKPGSGVSEMPGPKSSQQPAESRTARQQLPTRHAHSDGHRGPFPRFLRGGAGAAPGGMPRHRRGRDVASGGSRWPRPRWYGRRSGWTSPDRRGPDRPGPRGPGTAMCGQVHARLDFLLIVFFATGFVLPGGSSRWGRILQGHPCVRGAPAPPVRTTHAVGAASWCRFMPENDAARVTGRTIAPGS